MPSDISYFIPLYFLLLFNSIYSKEIFKKPLETKLVMSTKYFWFSAFGAQGRIALPPCG